MRAEAVSTNGPAGDRRDYGGENVAPTDGVGSEWTVGTLKEYTTGMITALGAAHAVQMADLKEMLQERYDAQVKAGEVAFNAQQTALATGLTAQKQAVDTALAAAKEATNKAESSANTQFKQFQTETGALIKALTDKFELENSRISDRVGEVTARLNTGTGVKTGETESRSNARLDQGQLLAIAGFLVALVAVVSGNFLN